MTTNAEKTFQNVKKLIQKEYLLQKGMHVIVGLSGGPDSVCLFDMLCRLAEELALQLYPVHVNHQFRPGAAERDQAFCETLCTTRGWPCRSFVYDCAQIAEAEGMTAEEAGRKVRYEAFGMTAADLLRRDIAAQEIAIAVAQNANDQAETILFRILRGTGTDGLAGIAKKRYETVRYDDAEVSEEVCGAYTREQAQHSVNDGKETGMREELCSRDDARRAAAQIAVIRPLLETQRAEIERYLAERNMTACIDQTNAEPIYTRNKIRLELLPYLAEQYNENIIAALNRLGSIAQHDKAYLQETAARAFADARVCGETAARGETAGCVEAASHSEISAKQETAVRGREAALYLSCDVLRGLHTAIRTRVYQRALQEIGMTENFSSVQAEAIEHLLYAESPSAETALTGGYRVARVYNRLRFYAYPHIALQDEGSERRDRTEAFCICGETICLHRAGKASDDVKTNKEAPSERDSCGAWQKTAAAFPAISPAAAAGTLKAETAVKAAEFHIGEQRYRLWQTDTAAYLALLAAGRLGVHGAFCADALPAGARVEVRTRRDGDYLPIRGGRKKLQDFLVDAKVPKNRRDELLLLTCGSRILWILPSPLFHAPQLREKGRFCADAKVDRKCAGPIIILEISNIL